MKLVAQNNKHEQIKLGKDFKLQEKNLNTPEDIENYNVLKTRLENRYEHITEEIKIRRRFKWY